jgi:hypothetical protein
VFRWDVEPSTGAWLEPVPLTGHERDVVDLGVAAAGRSLVTVSEDQVIRWDMTGDDGLHEARRGLPAEPSAWLDRACAIVGRDFTRSEWDRYLPGRPYHATCTDLL